MRGKNGRAIAISSEKTELGMKRKNNIYIREISWENSI